MTGACGIISSLLIPELSKSYDLRLTDFKESDSLKDLRLADLADPDRDSYRHLFQGVDTVIHNGFMGSGTTDTAGEGFEAEHGNIRMAYNVYQTAWEEGVRRVIMTSSNHAADYYEELLLDGKMDYIDQTTQNRSYGYYGWAKDSYEHLGFVFALGRVNGRPLSNVQMRIGAPRETDLDEVKPGDFRRMRRALGAYISQRDLVQLYTRSIETENIEDEQGVPFQVFYGISGNSHAFWSIANARKVIGYQPQDNSEVHFNEKVRRFFEAS